MEQYAARDVGEKEKKQDICDEASCFQDGKCVPIPEHASCATDSSKNVWICNPGYEAQ